MSKLELSRVSRLGAAALLAAAGVVVLSGCEEHPYPSPVADESSPPPPAPPTHLMGAPDGADGQPPPPAYAPSPYDAAQQPPGPRQFADARPYRSPGRYPSEYGRGANDGPMAVISNAPVPNPPEREEGRHRYGGHGWRHRHHHHWLTPTYAAAATSAVYAHHRHHHDRRDEYAFAASAPIEHHHHHHHHHHGQHPVVRVPATGGREHWRWEPSGDHRLHGHGHHHHHLHAQAGVQAPAAAAAAAATAAAAHNAVHAAPHPGHVHGPAATILPVRLKPSKPHAAALQPAHPPVAGAQKPAPNTAAPAPTSGDVAQHYAALQSGLTDVVAHQASLNSPSRFDANKTVDVSLVLPTSFAQTFRDQAARQNLSDQADSVNINAHLVGDGFTIAPDQPQSVPLTLGQQTVFRWKATPQANAKGPLHVDVSADLLSAGRNLPLGAVQSLANVGKVTGRVIGVGLLVLIALVLLGWAAQRRRPTAAGATRPRANHESGR